MNPTLPTPKIWKVSSLEFPCFGVNIMRLQVAVGSQSCDWLDGDVSAHSCLAGMHGHVVSYYSILD